MSVSSTLLSRRILLDDGGFKRDALEARDMDYNIAGGGEVAIIVAATVALTGLAALIASGLHQSRLLFQQLVQRFLDATPDQFLNLLLLQ